MWQSRDNTPLSFSLPPTLVHPHVTLPLRASQHSHTESFSVLHLIHCLLSGSPTHSALSFFHRGFPGCVRCISQNYSRSLPLYNQWGCLHCKSDTISRWTPHFDAQYSNSVYVIFYCDWNWTILFVNTMAYNSFEFDSSYIKCKNIHYLFIWHSLTSSLKVSLIMWNQSFIF